jgi:hypothetical protein
LIRHLILFSILTLSLVGCGHAATDDDDGDLALSESAKRSHLSACRDSSLYTCIYEQYGKDLQTVSEESDFSCITFDDGATLCPTGTTFRYDSKPFEQQCALTNCGKTFNYYDYKCRANIPGAGGNESSATRTIETALHQAYDNCLEALKHQEN